MEEHYLKTLVLLLNKAGKECGGGDPNGQRKEGTLKPIYEEAETHKKKLKKICVDYRVRNYILFWTCAIIIS
jgi:hypothetical protein